MLADTMKFTTLNVLHFTENRLKPNKDRCYSRSGMHLAYTSFFLCPPPMFWVVVGPCTELFAQAKCEIP